MSTVNTKVLQLQSVINYMNELGYEYLPVSAVFQSELWSNRGRQEVRLSTAIKLHNGEHNEIHGKYFKEPFLDIPHEWFVSANSAKIVYTAKLQHSKRKGLIVQSHVVKFVNSENIDLFIKE